MSFKNKVVLITGGSAGIGATTAKLFAKECAAVAIAGRDEAHLSMVAESCQELGATVLAIETDIAKDHAADTIVRKTIEKFGKLDVLVNNAGILREVGIFAENFLETFDEVMNINLRGAARITRFAVPYLVKTKGNIVNVSSVAATSVRRPNNIAYKTSKAAVNHFTRCVALELAPHGVRVNSISPGPVRTGIFQSTSLQTVDLLTEYTALHRVSEAAEIADLILYVAGEKAKSITGSNYIIDNGMMLV